MNIDRNTRLVNWISTKEELPSLGEIVIIFRANGQNEDHVTFGVLEHVHGCTPGNCQWRVFSGTGWGIAVDESEATHFMTLPERPYIKEPKQ